MESNCRKLHFSIQGEFITKLARERLYYEHDMKNAITLLLSCTETDEMSADERLGVAIGILDGKYSLKGTYPGEDYGMEEHKDYTPLGFMNVLKGMAEQIEELRESLRSEREKTTFLFERMEDWELKKANQDFYEAYDEPLFGDVTPTMKKLAAIGDYIPGGGMLESYLARNRMNMENGDDGDEDYGWLDPSGEFYPVEWCKHEDWAADYLKENHPRDDEPELYTDDRGIPIPCRDVLIYKLNWVLLHSPYQGVAEPTFNPARPMTKKQKEMLYGYYMDRNLSEKANAIFSGDDD